MLDVEALAGSFRGLYGRDARLFYAPGRVNLIGEHTDYNDGFVLPIAIDRGTAVAAAAREDRRVVVWSQNYGERAEFHLDAPAVPRRGHWLDYVEGVARSLESRGARLAGVDLAVESDVPEGAGLSSSAALEVSTAIALVAIAGTRFDPKELALACQEAEHVYAGTMCGVMDQLISTFAVEGHALLIDCRSLEHEPIPIQLPDHAVLVCDTRVKHSLATSEYNTRRAECEEGVAALRRDLPSVRALRDVGPQALDRHRSQMSDTVYRRCRHVVTENERTLAAAGALREGDADALGRLMLLSHASLRDDYQVSCAELDELVSIAGSLEGVAGARMTGGGFGGSAVCLVERARLFDVRAELSRQYAEAVGYEPLVYSVEASGGAAELGGLRTGAASE
jgi:galactokinase